MCKVQPFSGYSFIIYHLHMPLYFVGTFTGYPCYKKYKLRVILADSPAARIPILTYSLFCFSRQISIR